MPAFFPVAALRGALAALACASLLAGCVSVQADMTRTVDSGRKAILPGKMISAAQQAGDLLFTAGTLGYGKDQKMVEGGITPETRQVMENIKENLALAGLTMADVVKVNVYIKNADDFPKMNEVYQTYFPVDPPARTTIVTNFPGKAVNVEIEMIAFRRK